jgi:serine-type D-Ala-D-Ala carboxypeptidase/endopeptidase (penicillin-binding protein 4)
MRSPLLLQLGAISILLVYLTGCSSNAEERGGAKKETGGIDLSRYQPPRALDQYVDRLISDGRDWQQHGVYVESLHDPRPIAVLNEAQEFNPASVLKLATSLAALHKLGSDFHFRTEFRADGEIRSGKLNGDLILVSGGDPAFSISDARRVGEAIRQSGIRQVTGQLLVVGHFTCNENSSTAVSTRVFARHSGISFKQPPRFIQPDQYQPGGKQIATVESDSLLKIVQYLNSFSVNSMAETLALHIGGPSGVERFLIEEIGLPRQSVFISHASGLDVNRLTPRDTVRLLREIINWLDRHNLPPSAVMPVAGRDAGTLRERFAEQNFAGSVIGKTGTLYSTDSGVAALAGILYTRRYGPLLFAVYDMAEGRRVDQLRRLQDQFLKELIDEFGGPAPVIPATSGQPGIQIESLIRLSTGEILG